ncbi:MAG TPA: hypothetical protein PK573_02045 [Spirochaetota bacterium]|nr:hypothetical protein [Spirochaetota bacterium]HRZ26389.1 hypothetical protein [Spirochaetota bacterium]HSA15681.1 hypothetical protein [Spirochaetota bacterium]
MRYEKMFMRFLELDNNARIPLSVRAYMIISPRFRKEISALRSTLEKLKHDGPYEVPAGLSGEVMERIQLLGCRYGHTISTLRWAFTGLVIWLSIMLITFSDSFSWLTGHFGARLLVPLNIVFGIGISIYAGCYIFSHLDDLKKRSRYRF